MGLKDHGIWLPRMPWPPALGMARPCLTLVDMDAAYGSPKCRRGSRTDTRSPARPQEVSPRPHLLVGAAVFAPRHEYRACLLTRPVVGDR